MNTTEGPETMTPGTIVYDKRTTNRAVIVAGAQRDGYITVAFADSITVVDLTDLLTCI
jgi:hypothetical protein